MNAADFEKKFLMVTLPISNPTLKKQIPMKNNLN